METTKEERLSQLSLVSEDLSGLIKELEEMLNHYQYSVSVLADRAQHPSSQLNDITVNVIKKLQKDTPLISLFFNSQVGQLKLFRQYLNKDMEVLHILLSNHG